MFDSLIKSYLGGEVEKDPDKQMVYLHLLALNFQEFFDAKPLFEELDKKLPEDKKEELRKIAKKIASKQVTLLTKPWDKIPELSLVEGEGKTNQGEFKLTVNGSPFTFLVELLSIGSSSAEVRVSGMETIESKPLEFAVSFYDMPFMDNTKLMNGSRFAFILKNLDLKTKTAVIQVIFFPEKYMSLRDRPYFEEMLSKVRE